MSGSCQSPAFTRGLAAFGLERPVDIGSTWVYVGVSEMPGVARRQPTFFASPKKVGKERRPEVRRPRKSAGMPSVTRNDRPLRNSGSNRQLRERFKPVLALRQSSRTPPVVSALLGDSHRDPAVLRRPRFISVVLA